MERKGKKERNYGGEVEAMKWIDTEKGGRQMVKEKQMEGIRKVGEAQENLNIPKVDDGQGQSNGQVIVGIALVKIVLPVRRIHNLATRLDFLSQRNVQSNQALKARMIELD